MTSKQSQIINKVLSPTVKLWLRSQAERVEDLQVNIEAGDRQILTGYIPRVSIQARHAVYQGLHLSQIHLVGENIRVNVGQALKGQPIRLLEPLPVRGQLLLEETDLKASLASPLLSTALTDLLNQLLQSPGLTNPITQLSTSAIVWEKVAINSGQLTLEGSMKDGDNTNPVVINTGLQLASSHELLLQPLQIQMPPQFPLLNLEPFAVDLGPEVAIEELTLTLGQIVFRGSLKILP